MPKVPERELSYGEVLEKLKVVHRSTTRRKEMIKALTPKKRKQKVAKEYTYQEVIDKIKDIANG